MPIICGMRYHSVAMPAKLCFLGVRTSPSLPNGALFSAGTRLRWAWLAGQIHEVTVHYYILLDGQPVQMDVSYRGFQTTPIIPGTLYNGNVNTVAYHTMVFCYSMSFLCSYSLNLIVAYLLLHISHASLCNSLLLALFSHSSSLFWAFCYYLSNTFSPLHFLLNSPLLFSFWVYLAKFPCTSLHAT